MAKSEDFDPICYKRNFLTNVIVRIDFVSPITALEKAIPKDISQKALKHYPISEPKKLFMQKIDLSKEKTLPQREEFTEWNFHGRNHEKQLAIAMNWLWVSYKSYSTYEILRTEFLDVIVEFFKVFPEAQASRLGLRYINEINEPGANLLDWTEYICPDILGLFSYNIKGAQPSRIFHNLEFVFNNEFNLLFQFGINNPDYPAPIKRRSFVLDYDAYFKGLLDPKDIGDCLDKYHAAIQMTFEQNVTAKLRQVMNDTK